MSYNKPNSNTANFNFIERGYTPSQADDADFNFTGLIIKYYILAGTSNYFTSIWAYNGKMYVASSDTFSVVNLESAALTDYYTQTDGGNNNETLIGDDIVDINANM